MIPYGSYTAQTMGRDQKPQNDPGFEGSGALRNYRRTAMHGYKAGMRNLLGMLPDLRREANRESFSPEGRAAFLSPHVTALDDSYTNAQGNLAQALSSRGMSDSSAMAAGTGALAGSRARAGGEMVSGLYQAEEERQREAQARLAAVLQALMSGAPGALSLMLQNRGLDLQRQAMKPDPFSDILGGLGAYAGSKW